MARYIDTDIFINNKLIPLVKRLDLCHPKQKKGVLMVIQELNEQPTADVEEVKHGEWTPYKTEDTYGIDGEDIWYKCSVCGEHARGRCYDDKWYSYPQRTNYCPDCGAKMVGGNI